MVEWRKRIAKKGKKGENKKKSIERKPINRSIDRLGISLNGSD